ncbi:MAG TPA: S8 family serine peptidase, partial [Christiangramia sp.]|nr:S8 family serine peptidase [Christiangramia sp.]
MKKLLLFAFLLSFSCYAQEEHAWVFFKDKPDVQQALENPSTILSAKAIERKSLRGTPIDERDIPVNEEYISIIKDHQGISVKAKSKWLNCIHVIGTVQKISELSSLDFVSQIEYANKNLSSRSQSQIARKNEKLETNIDFDYGLAENQVQMLNTDLLHENDFTGEGITIAVMDSGFPNVNTMSTFDRLRTQNKLLGGYDFPGRSEDFSNPSLNYHGTLVLATMAGFIENSFIGTAPDASYYLFRTEVGPTETPVEETYWVEAAERADSLGVDMINTSLGYTLFDNPDYNYSPEDMDGGTTFISRGANIATEKGLLVVTSAGNRGDENYFQIIGAPADANVLSVGAVGPDRNYAFFSSIGPSADGRVKPDVTAQGFQIITVNEFEQLVQVNGTSFSSPILAGSIASLW